MSNTSYKPKMPDLMEAVFDTGYLLFDLIAGIVFLAAAKGNSLYMLYGILTHDTLRRRRFSSGSESDPGRKGKQ